MTVIHFLEKAVAEAQAARKAARARLVEAQHSYQRAHSAAVADLRKCLTETRAAVRGGRASTADMERKLQTMPVGSDPDTVRSLQHYVKRAKFDLAEAERAQIGLVARLADFGEVNTID